MKETEPGSYISTVDEQLMMAIHKGHTEAFNVLYDRYFKRLSYYFYRMLGNSEDKAQDFVQDLFVKIIEKPDMFDTSRRFSTWIFSVAHNMCKNEFRRIAVRANNIADTSVEAVELNTDDRLTADRIFKELDAFNETEKNIFILYYREDFSLSEISQILDLPEGTIKSKLFYTRRKLSAKLLENVPNK